MSRKTPEELIAIEKSRHAQTMGKLIAKARESRVHISDMYKIGSKWLEAGTDQSIDSDLYQQEIEIICAIDVNDVEFYAAPDITR